MSGFDKKEINSRCKEILTPLIVNLSDLLDKDLSEESDSFANGAGYIQHSAEVVNKCQREFLNFCYEVTGNSIFNEKIVHRQGIVGRYLDDGGSDLYKHWHRFVCIDENNREWGQPFFALNPTKGKQRCLNDLPSVRSKMRDVKLNEII